MYREDLKVERQDVSGRPEENLHGARPSGPVLLEVINEEDAKEGAQYMLKARCAYSPGMGVSSELLDSNFTKCLGSSLIRIPLALGCDLDVI